jgi:hypothetical protein
VVVAVVVQFALLEQMEPVVLAVVETVLILRRQPMELLTLAVEEAVVVQIQAVLGNLAVTVVRASSLLPTQ